MLVLVITVVVGFAFALFATQNTQGALLNIERYTLENVPVYLIALIPLLVGLLLAYLIHAAKTLSQGLTISELNDKNKELENNLAEITKKAHKLELENTKLKTKLGEPQDENSL